MHKRDEISNGTLSMLSIVKPVCVFMCVGPRNCGMGDEGWHHLFSQYITLIVTRVEYYNDTKYGLFNFQGYYGKIFSL